MTDSAPRVSLRRALGAAMRIVWRAAPREFVFLLGTQIVSALALVAQLALAGRVLEELTGDGEIDSFEVMGPILLVLVAVRVVVSITSVVRNETRLVVDEKVRREAALEMYGVAVAVELAEFDDADFHDRLRRAHSNIDRRIWSTVWSLVAILTALTTLAALVVVLVVVAPVVLVAAIIGALPLWYVRRRNNQAMYRLSYDLTSDDRERMYLERLLVERDPAAEVRAYELGPRMIRRIDDLYRDRVDRLRDLVRRRTAWASGAAVLSNVLSVGAIALLVKLIIDGSISVADGGVALLALQQAAVRLDAMSESVGSMSGAALFLDDYETFVAQAVPALRAEPLRRDDLTGVRLAGVGFTYPGQTAPTIRGVDLEVHRGELVALVGVNGSGKSTLAKLIAGLYAIDDGELTWETTHGPVTDRHRIGRTVGLVFQHFLRFELSAADNVTFGDTSSAPDHDRAWTALEQAGAAELMTEETGGLEARLGRSFAAGRELSAGQWQRVGIARAFYRDAPLLVLDEPTAAVDAKAEEELFNVVRTLQRGRGVLLITHRMATVREADRIYVLDAGRIVEVGAHAELIAAGGLYAELYDIQARSYRDE